MGGDNLQKVSVAYRRSQQLCIPQWIGAVKFHESLFNNIFNCRTRPSSSVVRPAEDHFPMDQNDVVLAKEVILGGLS